MLWPERPQERLYWWGWSAHGQCGAKAEKIAVARAPAELTAPGPLRDAAASRSGPGAVSSAGARATAIFSALAPHWPCADQPHQ